MKISLSWYGKVAERAMTWGGSSLPCSAQVKVKSPQSLGRIPQPLGSYSTTHGGHSWQGEFLLKGPAGCLPFTKDSTASCCGERNTAPTSHALVTFWEVIDSWKVRLGKDLERDELGHIAERNRVLFRDGTKTTGTNLDEPGQSVGIFLKIFAPVSGPRPTESETGDAWGGQRTGAPVILMCTHIWKSVILMKSLYFRV